MYAREIKDLAIAHEALARVHGTEYHCLRILGIIDNLLKVEEIEPSNPEPKVNQSDEIPF